MRTCHLALAFLAAFAAETPAAGPPPADHTLTIRVDSDPPGADLYAVEYNLLEVPRWVGTTPHEFTVTEHADGKQSREVSQYVSHNAFVEIPHAESVEVDFFHELPHGKKTQGIQELRFAALEQLIPSQFVDEQADGVFELQE